MVSEESIELSILGFIGQGDVTREIVCETNSITCAEGDIICEEENACTPGPQTLPSKAAYFDDLYSYKGYNNKKHIKAALSVREIIKQDRILFGSGLTARINGLLFCRNENGLSQCTKNWYTTSDLHYKLLFAEI